MFEDLTPLYPLVVPFLLVLFRLLGLFAFTPFFSNVNIPGNVKVLLSLAIALCVWNAVPHLRGAGAPTIPQNLVGLVVAVAGEMSVGLLIGLLLSVMFMGVQMGAHLISQQMGLSLATVYDPSFDNQSTVVEQVAFWIALVTFLVMGGHREMIHAIVYSYQKVPLGGGGLSPGVMLAAVTGALEAAMHAAARIALPALVASFIATLTCGIMSRSMPQLNLLTVGIALHLIVGMIMIGAGLTGWALISQRSIDELFRAMGRVLGG